MSTARDYRPDYQQCKANQKNAGTLLVYVFVVGVTVIALAGWWAGL